MSGANREAKSESLKEQFPCVRFATIKQGKQNPSRRPWCPPGGLSHECVVIAFRFIPFSDVAGDFADFFRLPDGFIGIYLGDVVSKGLPAAMDRARDGDPPRDSQDGSGYRAHSRAIERATRAASPPGPVLLDAVCSVRSRRARTHLFSNAGMPRPLLISGTTCLTLGEGGLPSGMFPGAAYERPVVQLSPETAFCSRPTVSTNCATGRESSSALPEWRMSGHNVNESLQLSRGLCFRTPVGFFRWQAAGRRHERGRAEGAGLSPRSG